MTKILTKKNQEIYYIVGSESPKKRTYNDKKETKIICLFKKLLFTMENATAADSSQSNISRIYI